MIDEDEALHYYTRPLVKAMLVAEAADKEVGVMYGESFGKRPDVLLHDQDVVEFAKQHATSFHASEEIWHNPLLLSPTLRRQELDQARKGWDLILDIDCKYWELSRLFTHLFVEALRAHRVKNVGIKFSGNKGFHICVPFEEFPPVVNKTPIAQLFPDGCRKIAQYLLDYVTLHIKVAGEHIFLGSNAYTLAQLSELTGVPAQDLLLKQSTREGMKVTLNTLSLIGLDTLLISSRHMYRMPYSLHEKSGLASLPILPNQVLSFDKQQALPEKVVLQQSRPFLIRSGQGSASALLIESLDHKAVFAQEQNAQKREHVIIEGMIPEDCFPPCMQKLLAGLEDGRKRALFILLNFLSSCNWPFERTEERLRQWNMLNKEPLHEHYVVGQLRYYKQQHKKMLPPNCDKYYVDIGVCIPDALCASIKNPFQYAKKKYLAGQRTPRKRRTSRTSPADDVSSSVQ
ncbi:MAG: hypothetical protein V1725_06030 [archaeon]